MVVPNKYFQVFKSIVIDVSNSSYDERHLWMPNDINATILCFTIPNPPSYISIKTDVCTLNASVIALAVAVLLDN